MSIAPPNYTQIPNIILDRLSDLTGAQLKVMLLVCRETFGFHRQKTRSMKLAAIMSHTGLSKQGAISAIDVLVKDLGWVKKIEGNSGCVYEINIQKVADTTEKVKKFDHKGEDGRSKNLTEKVKKIDQGEVKKFDHSSNKDLSFKKTLKETPLTPQGEREEEGEEFEQIETPKKEFIHPVEKTDALFRNAELPPWRSRKGVNGLRKEFVEHFRDRMKEWSDDPNPSEANAKSVLISWENSSEQAKRDRLQLAWDDFEERRNREAQQQSAVQINPNDQERQERLAFIETLKPWIDCGKIKSTEYTEGQSVYAILADGRRVHERHIKWEIDLWLREERESFDEFNEIA